MLTESKSNYSLQKLNQYYPPVRMFVCELMVHRVACADKKKPIQIMVVKVKPIQVYSKSCILATQRVCIDLDKLSAYYGSNTDH